MEKLPTFDELFPKVMVVCLIFVHLQLATEAFGWICFLWKQACIVADWCDKMLDSLLISCDLLILSVVTFPCNQ